MPQVQVFKLRLPDVVFDSISVSQIVVRDAMLEGARMTPGTGIHIRF